MKQFSLVVGVVFGLVHLGNQAQAALPPTPAQLKALYAQKVSPFVAKELSKSPKAEVMVVMKDQAGLSLDGSSLAKDRTARIAAVYQKLVAQANQSQKELAEYLDKKGIQYQRFFISNAILLTNATPEVINDVIQFESVGKVLNNPKIKMKRPLLTEVNSSINLGSGIGENLIALGVDKIWKTGVQGQNIVVAGQDTGVQWDHPALKEAYRGNKGSKIDHNYNWHDAIHSPFNPQVLGGKIKNVCGYETTAPCDDDKHGSHTMGTMIGSDGGQNQIGMAPKAKWIACRNMDAGAGKPSTYLECFQWFLAPTPLKGNAFKDGRPEMAPHVINNSWGCPPEEGCSGEEFLPALKALKEAGIMVVVSAGNDGPDCSSIKDPPAYHSGVALVVGAHDHRTGKIADFSSRGPSSYDGGTGPDITAPGVDIRSSVPGSKYEQAMWSGTSMAGPHAAGLVALMWSANPVLVGNIDHTIDIIHKTAARAGSSQSCGGVSGAESPNNTYGYGRIRPVEAIAFGF